MRWIREITPQPEHNRLYRQAMVITLGGNIFLAITKGAVAALTGSVALYADAANSVSDVVYSLMMVFGLWAARRPPDLSHPQGHSRFEPLVGLFVTASMAFAGFSAARAAIERTLEGGMAVELGPATAVLLMSAVIKTGMFFRIRWIARKVSSPTLETAAQDNLSDVLTSLAAFIGVLGSVYIHPLMDAAAGLLVSMWIFRAAYRAGRENFGFLTGAGADESLRLRMVREVESVPGVLRVHHLMSEYTGPRLVVDLHVNVDGTMTLTQAHDISDEVIARLEALPEVDRVYVHIEPEGYD